MKLGDERANWIGFVLLLVLVAAIALGLKWFNLPKLPV